MRYLFLAVLCALSTVASATTYPLATGAILHWPGGMVEVGESAFYVYEDWHSTTIDSSEEPTLLVVLDPSLPLSYEPSPGETIRGLLHISCGQQELTVYAEGRGNSGASSSAGSSSAPIPAGHAWSSIQDDETGERICNGNYVRNNEGRRGHNDDSDRCEQPGVVSHTIEINQEQYDRIKEPTTSDSYNLLTDNCVNMVERQLDAAGIEHDSFRTVGIGDPNKVCEWIKNENKDY